MAILKPTQPTAPPVLAARQGPVITQVITQPSTTYTAYVTLGDGGDPTATPAAVTTTTASPGVPPIADDSGPRGLSQADIGAILGCVVAFVTIVLVTWYCVAHCGPWSVRLVISRSSAGSPDSEAGSQSIEEEVPEHRHGGLEPQPAAADDPAKFEAGGVYYHHTAKPQMKGVRKY